MDAALALEIRKPLEALEAEVVNRALRHPSDVGPELVAALRYVLSFARLTEVRARDGEDSRVDEALAAHRWRVAEVLRGPLSGDAAEGTLWGAVRVLPDLVMATRQQRGRLLQHFPLDRDSLEAEVTTRQLVVVSAGGGGSGYGHAGAFALLNRHNLDPDLLAGTSMGALISLFRARRRRFDSAALMAAARRLSWNRVFKVLDADSRYGVPATLRLYLRGVLGDLFLNPTGLPVTFRDLEIPLLVVSTGLTVNSLKHDLSWYEHIMDDAVATGVGFRPAALMRLGQLAGVARELVAEPDSLREIVFGGDPSTLDADVLDAAGFSSSVTGLIHYDVYRDDQRMKALLDQLYALHGITRLTEGGLVNNLPAKPAFAHVMSGALGRRNPFVLALDCFSPQRRSVIFYPLQQLARLNVVKNQPYANVYLPYTRRLSPVNLVPQPEHLVQSMRWTMDELTPHMPFISAMCAPLPVLPDEPGRLGSAA